jgi:hypothetical protein
MTNFTCIKWGDCEDGDLVVLDTIANTNYVFLIKNKKKGSVLLSPFKLQYRYGTKLEAMNEVSSSLSLLVEKKIIRLPHTQGLYKIIDHNNMDEKEGRNFFRVPKEQFKEIIASRLRDSAMEPTRKSKK